MPVLMIVLINYLVGGIAFMLFGNYFFSKKRETKTIDWILVIGVIIFNVFAITFAIAGHQATLLSSSPL